MKLVLLLWIFVLSVPLGWVLGFHNAPHKTSAIHSLKVDEGYQLHHIIGSECKCSQRVLEHLLTRKKMPNFTETIYLVGKSQVSADRIKEAGFQLVALDEEEARSQYGITSVPFLVVSLGDKNLYSGGYARNQQHAESFDDETIASKLRKGESIEEFPVFGCANGKLAKKTLDPWGFKYGND